MTMLADELPLKTIGKYDDVGLGLHKNEVFQFIILLLFIFYYFNQFHYELSTNHKHYLCHVIIVCGSYDEMINTHFSLLG